MTSLRAAGRGSARDLAGMRYEHLRVLLEDENQWGMLAHAATLLARGEVPQEITEALALGRLTAFRKSNGKVRGIVTSSIFRRLVAKTLAAQFGEAIMAATAPYQFALQTRAGTDTVGHALRLLSDLNPDMVIVSLDGLGAYDHVKRSAMFQKLLAVPALHGLIPFVRTWYSRQSHFLWSDDAGTVHDVMQGEGGEQGDPLMPALFALAQHDALHRAKRQLHESDTIFAFLDDLYLFTSRERAKGAFDTVTEEVSTGAGVRTHLGNLRLWSKAGGECPPGFEQFGAKVWAGGAEPAERGVKILGTPLGHPEFVAAHAAERMAEEKSFLDKLFDVPDLQVAWLLLLFCGVPRANHLLRVLPPSAAASYARDHDRALWECLCSLLGAANHEADKLAWGTATLPLRKVAWG